MQRFRACALDQPFLMPPSLPDWLPEDYLARFIAQVAGELDLGEICQSCQRRDGRGKAACHPEMMVRGLLYCEAAGVRSSRRIERTSYEDVAVRYLSADQHPDHDTMAAFRREHLEALSKLFVEVLVLCGKAGLEKIRALAVETHEDWIEATRFWTWICCGSSRRAGRGWDRRLSLAELRRALPVAA